MLDRRQLLTLLLIAITAGAWAYIIGPTINYLQYYSALEQVSVEITRMTVNSTDSAVEVSLNFAVSNPTSYLGLQFDGVIYQARLPNGSYSPVIGVGSADVGGPVVLKAYESVSLHGSFVLTGLGMTQFEETCQARNRILIWSVNTSLDLSTRNGDIIHQFEIPVTTTGC